MRYLLLCLVFTLGCASEAVPQGQYTWEEWGENTPLGRVTYHLHRPTGQCFATFYNGGNYSLGTVAFSGAYQCKVR
jgi:hypothetical protein